MHFISKDIGQSTWPVFQYICAPLLPEFNCGCPRVSVNRIADMLSGRCVKVEADKHLEATLPLEGMVVPGDAGLTIPYVDLVGRSREGAAHRDVSL